MPDVDEFLYIMDDDLACGLVSALDRQSNLGDYIDKPLDNWVVLGWFGNDMFLIDGPTGELRIFVDGEAKAGFLTSRVDFFARFLASFNRDDELLHPDFATPGEIEAAMNNLVVAVRDIDSSGVDHEDSYCPELADRIAWDY